MKIKKVIIIEDAKELPDRIIVQYEGHEFLYTGLYEHVKDNPRPLPSNHYLDECELNREPPKPIGRCC